VSVYVDEPIHPFGRMLMCHMMADTRAELDAMADRIGVARKWIQKAGTPQEHYDICQSKRVLAVKAGAIEVGARHLATLVRSRRAALAPDEKEGV